MAVKSTSRRTERREKVRADIIRVARDLFARYGSENVTLRAVAEEIGYSHAAIYRYFPDKAHLMAELVRETFALLVQDFDQNVAGLKDPKRRLFAASRGMIRFFVDHPNHCRIVFFGPEDRSGLRSGIYIHEMGEELWNRIEKVFQEVSDSGKYRISKPKVALHTWWSAMFGVAMLMVIQGEQPEFTPIPVLIDRLVDSLWRGLQG